MSSEFEQNLEKYAEVILKVGLNLQKGQRLMIIPADFASFPLEIAPFIEIIVRKAYQIGARFVDVMWDDPQIHLIRFQHAPRDSFEEYPIWRRDALLEFLKKEDAILGILASNPNLFINQDPKLMDITRRTTLKRNKPVNELIAKNATNWLVISIPVSGWTEKVFPDLHPDKGKAKLWDVIFDICRVKQKDPFSVWNDHINQLRVRMDFLSNKQYSTIKLKALDTDLTVGLPKEHKWGGGREKSQNGISRIRW